VQKEHFTLAKAVPQKLIHKNRLFFSLYLITLITRHTNHPILHFFLDLEKIEAKEISFILKSIRAKGAFHYSKSSTSKAHTT
jgi:hypothetical protein